MNIAKIISSSSSKVNSVNDKQSEKSNLSFVDSLLNQKQKNSYSNYNDANSITGIVGNGGKFTKNKNEKYEDFNALATEMQNQPLQAILEDNQISPDELIKYFTKKSTQSSNDINDSSTSQENDINLQNIENVVGTLLINLMSDYSHVATDVGKNPTTTMIDGVEKLASLPKTQLEKQSTVLKELLPMMQTILQEKFESSDVTLSPKNLKQLVETKINLEKIAAKLNGREVTNSLINNTKLTVLPSNKSNQLTEEPFTNVVTTNNLNRLLVQTNQIISKHENSKQLGAAQSMKFLSENTAFIKNQSVALSLAKAQSAITQGETTYVKKNDEPFVSEGKEWLAVQPFQNEQTDVNDMQLKTTPTETNNSTQLTNILLSVKNKVRYLKLPDMHTITINLNPKHLGEIKIQLIQKGNQLIANFTPTKEETKSLIERHIGELKTTLNSQQVNVDKVNVFFEGTEEQQPNQDFQQQQQKQDNEHDKNNYPSDFNKGEIVDDSFEAYLKNQLSEYFI